ncbi:aspartyl protease family protein [Lacipirellula parvula]|uniref:PDZ domain-containing protein n=1 Tax=Lacipirellula parvula TaxID=2650471 RepID=A0A5K7XJT9_9BACT|nr:aspartyl protease family protein [Lacipirellula parvula]BBO33159.1 hypothetical protein PLANPX_2771 [Lacipirellula parvula]
MASQFMLNRRVCYALLAITVFPLLDSDPASSACAADDAAVFPISSFEGDPLILPVTIAETEHLFVVDSGATCHLFDAALKSSLGPSRDFQLASQADGSEVRVEIFDAPDAKIGRLSLGVEAPVACADLSAMRERFGRNVQGILGLPFFAAYVIQLDFEKREMRILPGDAEPQEEWGQLIMVAKEKHSNLVGIRAKVAGLDFDEVVVLDSGFNGELSLRSDVYGYLAQEGQISSGWMTEITLVNKAVPGRQGRLECLGVGGFTHNQIVVSEGDKKGCIGLLYLQRYRVTLDLGRGRIFLEPNSRFHEPSAEPSLSGLTGVVMLRKAGKTIITNVFAGKPAAEAGVQVEDELLSVGSVPITTQPVAEIASLVRTEVDDSGNLALLVDREGKTKSFVLKSVRPRTPAGK